MSLAQGLYHLESLGIRGSKALKALALASQESAISGADLEQTTSALGAAIYVGIKGTGNLRDDMGILNATVGAGNMRMQDLVDALGTGILSSAKVAGLSIQDVGSALAVLSDGGQNASSAGRAAGDCAAFPLRPVVEGRQGAPVDRAELNGAARWTCASRRGCSSRFAIFTPICKASRRCSSRRSSGRSFPAAAAGCSCRCTSSWTGCKGNTGRSTPRQPGSGGVQAQRQDPLTQLKMQQAAFSASLIRFGDS